MGWFTKTQTDDRALAAPDVQSPWLPYQPTAPLDVNTSNALRVADAYACVRCLADSVASLPLHAYRKTAAGRVPAGGSQRIGQLLNRPSPGSTSADLLSQVMVQLNVSGECFLGK